MRYFIYILLSLTFGFNLCAQNYVEAPSKMQSIIFGSLDEVIDYAETESTQLKNNEVLLSQAKKAKLAAIVSVIDVTGNLLSAQFVNNTNLGVNLFPAEVFGGAPGTFQEVELGVQYNTNINSALDIKLYNPNGYNNLKLANINIDLTAAQNRVTLKDLHDNIAIAYYNIINLQRQIDHARKNKVTSDTLLSITEIRYNEGLIKQQDFNDMKVNHLQLLETLRQLDYLMVQHYNSLKILCDISEDTHIEIADQESEFDDSMTPIVKSNVLKVNSATIQEQYALQNVKAAKQALLPTISLQLSNSYNLYNTEFQPLSGNWINSNYVGLKVSVPIPNSQQVANLSNTQFEYEIAQNNTQRERNQSAIDQDNLRIEYDLAWSQYVSHRDIHQIQEDTYDRNQRLYEEGLIDHQSIIESFNTLLMAQFDLISSRVNLNLSMAKIDINNNIN